MLYTIFFFLSIAVWLVFAALAVYMRLQKKLYNFLNGIVLFSTATFISLILLHIPVNIGTFGDNPIKTVLASAYNALQTFTLNGSFYRYEVVPPDYAKWLQTAYPVWTSVMYVFAPILTFGFALSFFKNLSAYVGFVLGYRKEAYIFSSLNQRSIILAESIRTKYPKVLLIFANVQNSIGSDDFTDRCLAINTLRFNKNIRELNLNRHSKDVAMIFFLIDDDESINEQDALVLIPIYKNKTDVRIYLFSERIESDTLLRLLSEKCASLKLFRIDETQSLVFNYLYENSIFETAVTMNNEKIISVVIIGLDKAGAELLKALTWCGQMNGYKLIINAFDESPCAESRLRASCPELINRSGVKEKGEAYYEIVIHNGAEYRSSEFFEAVGSISPISYLFVTTGQDERDIDIAINIHTALERHNALPPICAYIRNPHKASLLREHGISNFKHQKYNISVFGDLESCYSHKRIMFSQLEQTALERHKKWGGTEIEFYTSEYNYRSSLAWVIRKKWRDVCEIDRQERTELEHKGWNSYMRSIGYSYSGSTEKASRNDRAKLHHNLVCFDKLSEAEKHKDEADL
jgi:uncharacterized protein (UPF0297 family)